MDRLKTLISTGYFHSIHGWCTPEKALKIAQVISDNNCKVCVELGVFGGKSLLPIALAAGPDGKIYGVDAWSSAASLEGTNDKANDSWWSSINYNDMYKYTNKLMKSNNVEVTLLRRRSNEVNDTFDDESIDFLHQDSNHSLEISCEEIELYFNKVKHGGFWAFDDTNWETTKQAQANLLTKGYIELEDLGGWKLYQRI
jgi:hypothetical protein